MSSGNGSGRRFPPRLGSEAGHGAARPLRPCFFWCCWPDLFSGVRDAKAVILYASAMRKTATPPAPPADEDDSTSEGWNYEATGQLPCHPDRCHALHRGQARGGSGFDHRLDQGNTYQVNQLSEQTDPGSDLAVWTLQSGIGGNLFPSYARLYNASPTADGSLVGKTLTVIGRGTRPPRRYRRRRDGGMVLGVPVTAWKVGAKRRQRADRL